MSLVAAIVMGATAASAAHAPTTCPACTLDAPHRGDAIPMLVVLRDEHAPSALAPGGWSEPAVAHGWAVLTVAGWEHDEPGWIAAQVRAAARRLPIDLARVYLLGSADGAAYIARHVQALSETFAALVITSGGGTPATSACPEQVLPAYFLVDARDAGARALRSYLERCKQPVVWSTRGPGSGPIDRATAITILDWLHRHVRVTTVAVDLPRSRVMLAG